MTESEDISPATDRSETGAVGDDLVLVQRMLELTPAERLLGLARAAAFFADARRV